MRGARLLNPALDAVRLVRGVRAFPRTGRTDRGAYVAMRRLHVRTGGRSTRWAARRLAHPHSGRNVSSGVLAGVGPDGLEQVAAALRRDGYVVLPVQLDPAVVDGLKRFASETPVRYLDRAEIGGWSDEEVLFDGAHPVSSRYQFRLQQMVHCPEVMELTLDESLGQLAGLVLGAEPTLDLISMWWSAPGFDELEGAAAQRFHFDLDRLRFVKLFFYLTDVGPENGPHCFVEGSHRRLAREIRREGRYDDDVIAAAYSPAAIREICGPAGTMLLVDTSGIHKGKPCVSGERLLLQFEYCSSLFGAPVDTVPLDAIPARWRDRVLAHRRALGVVDVPPQV